MRALIAQVRDDFPDVKICFRGAEAAAQAHIAVIEPERVKQPPTFELTQEGERLHIRLLTGSIFGPQPFLALKSTDGRYFHDNLDEVTHGRHWTYVMDRQTLPASALERVGVGAAGASGGYGVMRLEIKS